MAETIFLDGASGFVGQAVLAELLGRGYDVHALVNEQAVDSAGGRVTSFKGGLFDPAAVRQAMTGCAAAIHLVGIIMERPGKGITFDRIHYEGTVKVVDAAKAAGVRRYLQMSALGTRAGAVSAYHQSKYKAERYVAESGLDWTILRPSMIHGPRGEFMRMEARWARKKSPPFFFMPYFGAGFFGAGGAGRLQPVYVNDVARAFVDAIEKPATVGSIYDLGGSDQVTWPQLHRTVSRAMLGKRRWVMPLPAWYAKLLTHLVPRAMLPFNRDQVIMSQEDNTCDLTQFVKDFGWTPRGFEQTLAEYATRL